MDANFSGHFKNATCRCISKEFQKCGRQIYVHVEIIAGEECHRFGYGV
jgi:hypothetical protein